MTRSAAAVGLLALVFVPMAIEAMRAKHNEQRQFARGGIEAEGDVYRLMRVAYPAAFVIMILEGWLTGVPPRLWFVSGAALFAVAKLLKLWAIRSLGSCWTFRVIVVPGAALVTTGPYRYVPHPNYIAVIGELCGVAMMTRAVFTGPLAIAGFAWLIAVRIRVEAGALVSIGQRPAAKSPKSHIGA